MSVAYGQCVNTLAMNKRGVSSVHDSEQSIGGRSSIKSTVSVFWGCNFMGHLFGEILYQLFHFQSSCLAFVVELVSETFQHYLGELGFPFRSSRHLCFLGAR